MAKSKKYEINLIFLWLAIPKEAIRRVAQRGKQGGHYVSEEIIVRRYCAGLNNLLTHYLTLANRAHILDNSSQESIKRIIARKNINGSLDIIDRAIWEKIEKVTNE